MRTFVKIKGLLLCALLVVAQSLSVTVAQAQDFEGRATYAVTSPATGGEKSEMIMNFKGDKMMMSVNMGGMGVKMYSQNGGKKFTIVMEAMKMGIETEVTSEMTQQASNEIKYEFKATGKKETINGFAAEEWVSHMKDDATMTVWISADFDPSVQKGLLSAMKAQEIQNGGGANDGLSRMLAEKGMSPVRIIITADGEMQATIDLLKIEKTSIPDSIFVIPSDITIQKMDPSMMQQD